MLGGRIRSRGKSKVQEKDVSFRFHSGTSLETGPYLSESNRANPVFADNLQESQGTRNVTSDNENSFNSSGEAVDEKLVKELLESAIDDTNSDTTRSDHPLSDPLFDFDFEQEPSTHQELKSSDTHEKDINSTKELEYKETFSAPLELSDSEDSMNIKEKENYEGVQQSENTKLLDSDDEELFFSLTKGAVVNETLEDKIADQFETDDAIVKSHVPESDTDNSSAAVSPSKDYTSTSDTEDTTLLMAADTHPLLTTSSVDENDGEKEVEREESLLKDKHNYQLQLSEEHFSKISTVSEPTKSDQNLKTKPKRPPPPRPPLPSKMNRPNIVANNPTDARVNQTINPPVIREDADKVVQDITDTVTSQRMRSPSPIPDVEKTVQLIEPSATSEEDGDHRSSEEIVQDDSLSLPYFIAFTLIIFLYYSLNPSSYLAGFLTGFLFFFVITAVGFVYYVTYLQSIQQREREAVQKSLESSNQQFIDQLEMNFYSTKVYCLEHNFIQYQIT